MQISCSPLRLSFRATPAKAGGRPGIQDYQALLDSGFRRNDGLEDFCKSLQVQGKTRAEGRHSLRQRRDLAQFGERKALEGTLGDGRDGRLPGDDLHLVAFIDDQRPAVLARSPLPDPSVRFVNRDESAGLDPFVGFLHTDDYNKRSLVFDMIEPFRILGDRTTVLIITGRRAKREIFREIPGGMELSPEGRPALMESFNKRLDRTVRYPVQGKQDAEKKKYRKIAQRAVIQHEAHALANSLLGRTDLPRIVETEQMFADEA